MKSGSQLLRDCFHLLLFLYPQEYREEYGEELQTVFDLSMEDAIKLGKFAAVKVFLLEVIHLPGAIFLEHLRKRRKNRMARKIDRLLDFSPGSRNETLVALAPFLVSAALPILFGMLSSQLDTLIWQRSGRILAVAVYALIPLLFILGLLKGIPRWSLPYLGLCLPVLAWIISNINMSNALADYRRAMMIYRLLSRIPYSWSFLREFINEGVMWGWILIIPLTVLLILFSMLIPGLRPFYRKLRNDWTLLCFMLLGAAPFMAFVNFEGYKNYEAFIVLMFLSLAVAGWLYLHNDNPWAKFLILIGGMTIAMLVAALGQTMLFETSRYQEDMSLSTIKAWIWLLMAMLLTLGIRFLPRSRAGSQLLRADG
jgi:hypothetical protein